MRKLIYKDEVYKVIENCIRDSWDRISPSEAKSNIYYLVSDADEADRPQGEWIPDPDGGFRCSNCRAEEDEFIYGTGMRYVNGESEFCPNCGAKMKGAEDGTC